MRIMVVDCKCAKALLRVYFNMYNALISDYTDVCFFGL